MYYFCPFQFFLRINVSLSAGIPQIILPAWHDTYEFAARVEYLGIGIYGSKKSKSAPEADGAELGEALIAVTDDHERSRSMNEKAKKLAEVCNKYGGRAKAADKILEKCKVQMEGNIQTKK
jgi:UDP:flavonoid glycosyltransferase YjiC (YdhE family)